MESILAGFDDAIADGVDIISISIGSDSASKYDQDDISIGAFHGLKKGVLTINSAGNYGPSVGSISSVAPWILSVAASSTDRWIINKVVLGNGQTLLVCLSFTILVINWYSPLTWHNVLFDFGCGIQTHVNNQMIDNSFYIHT